MNHHNTAPHAHGPPVQNYTSRRQGDYHYPPPSHNTHHMPYPAYAHPQYHGAPPMHHYPPQQWYQPYAQYAPPMAYRAYQQSSPLVVSSNPHGQPVLPVSSRQPQSTQITAQPPPRVPVPDQSTSSTRSQALASPSRSTTPTSISVTTNTPPVSDSKPLTSETALMPETGSVTQNVTMSQQPQVTQRMPFYPQLPWLSVPEVEFPSKSLRRRRRGSTLTASSDMVQLPDRHATQAPIHAEVQSPTPNLEVPETTQSIVTAPQLPPSDPSNITTPPSTASAHKRSPTKPIVPVIPALPSLGHISPVQPKPLAEEHPQLPVENGHAMQVSADDTSTSEIQQEEPAPPARVVPRSWAELLKGKTAAAKAAVVASVVNNPIMDGITAPKPESLADVLSLYSVENDSKISFLEPRGLVNTGNMCYMNSVLQVLVFCLPFYEFLNQVGKRVVHSFKSEMPLVESMQVIMFMREFNVIDSATSVEQLRMRLKENDFEKYGDPFIPEFVYDVIKRLPRFSTMRRGHQQDAEEFLGFLLEGLHDDCALVMKNSIDNAGILPSVNDTGSLTNGNGESGWLEVGPKQKPAVTRSSGTIVAESPITKIFGGKLRSELRVPGLQNSVTLEPYQSLQLDIGDSSINNITDALKGLTRSETLHGDFRSPRGPNTNATKQVFIETLPPVLILHLKRFQYDNTGGTQKIWKKIGNPLELEIPKEVFPPQKRGQYTARPGGLPKYRLIGVVYHHGKNASGGHYTVDIRRQEGHEWIRMDDTIIRRVRSEGVAGESEEDPKILAKALEQHRRDQDAGRNIYEAAGLDKDADDEDTEGGEWSQVNGQPTNPQSGGTTATKKWPNVNGTGTETPSTAGRQTPRDKSSFKDNKVAYILFYERIPS